MSALFAIFAVSSLIPVNVQHRMHVLYVLSEFDWCQEGFTANVTELMHRGISFIQRAMKENDCCLNGDRSHVSRLELLGTHSTWSAVPHLLLQLRCFGKDTWKNL